MIEYKISMPLPDGATASELGLYIRESIAFAGGSFHPDHPFFNLKKDDICVEEIKRVSEKLSGGPFILDICLDIHTQNSGSLERQPDYDDVIVFLKKKLLSWRASPDFTRDFDEAVKNLIAVTLKESEVRNKLI